MAGADAALPEISARLLAIGVQRTSDPQPSRIWIAGVRGFLAYSEDSGRCWTPFDYAADAGEFRPGKSSCVVGQAASGWRWPQLVPSALAAPQAPRAGGAQQSGPARICRKPTDTQLR